MKRKIVLFHFLGCCVSVGRCTQLAHPCVYAHVTDDFSVGTCQSFNLVTQNGNNYVNCRQCAQLSHQKNSCMYNVHTYIHTVHTFVTQMYHAAIVFFNILNEYLHLYIHRESD